MMQKQEKFNIKVERAKLMSLLVGFQMRKLTLEHSLELERLLVKERNRAIQNGITDLDIILGYYLIGLDGYVGGGYYSREHGA
jgi:hypothetical protein